MNLLLLLAIILAALDWIAVGIQNRTLENIARAGMMIALLAWYWSSLPDPVPWYGYAFLIGSIFTIIGGAFLMVSDRFVEGLLAFLFSHIAYIIAFNATGPLINFLSISAAVVITIMTVSILRPVLAALSEKGQDKHRIPVTLYAIVLAATMWSTSMTLFRTSWPLTAGLLAAVGGALFYASDVLNGWRRFVSELKGGPLAVMVTYHLAQIALTAGMLGFLVNPLPGS
jgi:uncharacterized membrane protein YhhN